LPSLYRLAVKKRNIALLSQLNEGIDLVKVGPKCRELAMNGLNTGAMKTFQRAFIKYAAYAGVPVIFILFALFLWTWSPKRNLEERTRALQESEQSYHNQFANTTAMVLLDPADGAILDANAAALNFYGHPRQRLLAMRITPRPFGRSVAGHNIR